MNNSQSGQTCYLKHTGCIENNAPLWPEEMGNCTIEIKLFIEKYIQYDLFEPRM